MYNMYMFLTTEEHEAKLIKLKGEVNKSRVIVGIFNTHSQ